MSYEHSEEVEFVANGYEASVTLSCNVSCTDSGYPESGPSMSGPGEPGEGPTFECDVAYMEFGVGIGVLQLDNRQLSEIFGEQFMTDFYERAEAKAAENYDPSDDYDDSDNYD